MLLVGYYDILKHPLLLQQIRWNIRPCIGCVIAWPKFTTRITKENCIFASKTDFNGIQKYDW